MRISIKIYYEDTDCGGVVYYANYLKYFERGRTELLRSLGVSLSWLQDGGIVFVVRKAEAEYLSSARYDDTLLVDTEITGTTGATITFAHSIKKEGSERELVKGTVMLACVGRDGKPVRIPEGLKSLIGKA